MREFALWLKREVIFSILLQNQHGISVGKEAVPLLHRLLVGCHNSFFSSKGTDQHQQGGFWGVEVGKKLIHHFELIARIDENIGGLGARFQLLGFFVPG